MVGTKITIKFLCSYGGKIVPRYPDGKLRYYGGETRVLAVDRSIPFSGLAVGEDGRDVWVSGEPTLPIAYRGFRRAGFDHFR
ncbi:hypothetical protein Golob_026669 [Gossypium lobatum]|uniref:Uncharacterized protein n=1 Tax=Gossypium lobatum TaxID=34289 RepID=A0A7J8LW14_9ROSI|nr:hypothetical protein [Gossypium lobatum]